MFLRMRLLRAAAVVLALLLTGTALAGAATAPSSAAIRAALKVVDRSKNVWATFNVCDPKDARGWVGVRGQIQALGFPARERMIVKLEAWSASAHRYVAIPGHWTESFGAHSGGALDQRGVRLKWNQPVTVVAQVTFEWTRDGKLVGKVVKDTKAGIKRVDGSDPKGYSAGTCSVG